MLLVRFSTATLGGKRREPWVLNCVSCQPGMQELLGENILKNTAATDPLEMLNKVDTDMRY